MSNASQTLPNQDGAVPAYLEAGGRIYPKAAREKIRRTRRRQGPARGARMGRRLADRIREQFHARFVMDIDGAEYTDNDTLLEDYQYDIGLIRKACDDVREMLRQLYRLNTRFEFQNGAEYRSVASNEEAMEDAHYRSWSEGLDVGITVGDYGLSTRLTNLLNKEGLQGLENRREECLNDFIRQFCKLLDDMVEHDLVGLVVFGQDQDCDFHFFRDAVLEFELDKQTVTHISDERVLLATFTHEVIERRGTQTETTTGETRVRRTRQDIYLRDVHISGFGDERMPIPADTHAFIRALPEWLQDCCRIVEGTRYSQQFFDFEIKHVNWEQTTIRPYLSRVVEEIHRDPALTLGHYVLAGWDSTDVDQQRKEQESRWHRGQAATGATLASTYSGSMLLAAVASLALAILGFGLLPGGLGQITGALGMTGFIACAVGWFHYSAESIHRRINGVHHVLAAILAGLFAMSVLCVVQAFRSSNWTLLWAVLAAPAAAWGAWKLRELLPFDR